MSLRSDVDAVVAAVEHLDRDQWRHILQRLSPKAMAELRNAVADSFQIAADFLRASELRPTSKARAAAAGGDL